MDDLTPQQTPQQPQTAAASAPVAAPQIDSAMIDSFIAEKRAQQNLPMAIVAGFVASLVGASVWAAITVATEVKIGWVAVGVGFIVGYAVRFAGKGLDPMFGYIGAILALLGCVLGNLFSAVGFVAQAQSVGFFSILGVLDLSSALKLLELSFSPMDLLFYGIAVYEGYRFSFLQINAQDLPRA